MSHSGFTSPLQPPKHTLVIRMNFFDEQRSLGRVYDKSSGVSEGCRGASGGKLNGDISEKEPCTLRDARETFSTNLSAGISYEDVSFMWKE